MCRGLRVSGPLGPFAAGFVADLSRQGFEPVPVRKHMGLVAALSSWLVAEDVAPSGLSSEVAERFCAARRAAGHTNLRASGRSIRCWGICARSGVAPPASPPVRGGPVEELLASFRRYLELERGIWCPTAARGYVDKVRPFLERFDGPDGLELWRLDGQRCAGSWWTCARGRRALGEADGRRVAVAASVPASRGVTRAVAAGCGAVGRAAGGCRGCRSGWRPSRSTRCSPRVTGRRWSAVAISRS